MSNRFRIACAVLLLNAFPALGQQTTIDSSGLMKGIGASKERLDEVRRAEEEERQRRAEEARSVTAGTHGIVHVNLKVICAICANDRQLSLSGGPGRVEKSAVPYSLVVSPGGAGIAGEYRYLATWEHGRKSCNGKIVISGLRRNYDLNLHTTCSDGGSREY